MVNRTGLHPSVSLERRDCQPLAYQLHLPERDEGLVVALKRPASSSTKAALRLHDPAREATYEVTSFDTTKSKRISGSVLSGTGLEVELFKKPDSALVRYRRAP